MSFTICHRLHKRMGWWYKLLEELALTWFNKNNHYVLLRVPRRGWSFLNFPNATFQCKVKQEVSLIIFSGLLTPRFPFCSVNSMSICLQNNQLDSASLSPSRFHYLSRRRKCGWHGKQTTLKLPNTTRARDHPQSWGTVPRCWHPVPGISLEVLWINLNNWRNLWV